MGSDSCPQGEIGWTSNGTTDRDGDGCRDAGEDLDDDNDTVTDGGDNCPTVANTAHSNYDGDAQGDACAGLTLTAKVKNDLLGKLDDAQKLYNQGKISQAEGKLKTFITAVKGQRGKALTAAQADMLTSYANNIIALI